MRRTFPQDLTGMRFGRLTAMEIEGMRGPFYYWRCRCDCGKEIVTQRGSLLSGKTQSCGCIRREVAQQNAQKARTARWRSENESMG